MTAHVRHMYQKGGEDFVAVGTDLTGSEEPKRWKLRILARCQGLYDALAKAGFTERHLEKFWYGNAKRVIDAVL